METLNGNNQEVVVGNQGEAIMGNRNTYGSYVRLCLILVCLLGITGCSLGKIKTGLMTGAATATTVAAVSALTPSVIAPAVVGGVTGATVSALAAEPSAKGEPLAVTADTVVQQAPDNFFTLLGKLVGMGGWLLGLVLLLPMVLGWIIPGPLTTHKKKKKS